MSELNQNESSSLRETDNRSILVLFANPSIDHSEVNCPPAELTAGLPGVTLIGLYAEYPTMEIDLDREQQRLLDHDVIVFMHPLYWNSTSAILKEWQDLVLEHGFAYGHEGIQLHGKIFFSALTADAAESDYSSQGHNHFTIPQMRHPLEQMAQLCGMIYLPPFALFGARTAVEENRIQHHLADWQKPISTLHQNRLNLSSVMSLPKSNLCEQDSAMEAAT
jgi:glutathione-regulated potassium-efflux system ancillary protein KefG